MNTFKGIVISVLSFCIMLSTVGLSPGADEYSGFLENYPAFKPDADREGALIYQKEGVNLKQYTKVMIDPVEIWIAPDSKYKGLKPDDLKILADAFRQALVDALEPTYPVITKTGPDVLGIRIAITNVYMTKKKRGLLGYTPVGLVVSTAVKAVGDNMSLQDAAIEAELLDSLTNERLGALIDQQSKTGKDKPSASKLGAVQKGATSWEEIEEILRFYAQRLRGRLDAEHGR